MGENDEKVEKVESLKAGSVGPQCAKQRIAFGATYT